MKASKKLASFAGAGLAVVVIAVVAVVVLTKHNSSGPNAEAKKLAQAWSNEQFATVQFGSTPNATVTQDYNTFTSGLGSHKVRVTVASVNKSGATASALLHVDWSFGDKHWTYDTTADLARVNSKWTVQWKPSLVNPQLTTNGKLITQRTQPKRGDILGGDGTPLVTERDVVDVGIEPNRVQNIDTLTAQLATLLQVDGNALKAQVQKAKPDAFVEVVTLRADDYANLRSKLQPLPGTVFRNSQLPLSPSRTFASALLGRSGAVTADVVNKSNGRYQAGDIAGLSGLQQQYDSTLSGQAGVAAEVLKDDGSVVSKTDLAAAQDGQDVQTTLDVRTQNAAEAAIASQTKPTSLVAVKASTGQVLAVANGPDVGGDDRALTGQYPPGSSFKVVTAYALLSGGLGANDTVACPPTLTIDGKTFQNAEHEALGLAPFHTDFANSCNTAFINASQRLGSGALASAAMQFGLGQSWSLGTSAFTGSVPKDGSAIDKAADAFGQGKVLVSPLGMADVAATAASGAWHSPTLVTTPAPTTTTPAPTNLDPATVATLQSMMREVVTSGTGTAALHANGAPVYGKTGTAEFGNDNPPQTHAWFIGYQGDVAFAVLVEGGGFGGDVAAPIAVNFLNALNATSATG